MSGAVTVSGVRFDRRADGCDHTGTRLVGSTSHEEVTLCGECGTDLTVRTDPKLRTLIDKVYTEPPEVIAAILIAGRTNAVRR